MKKQTMEEKLAQIQALNKGKKTPEQQEIEFLKGEVARLRSDNENLVFENKKLIDEKKARIF